MPAAPGQDLLVALTLVSVVAVPVSTVILLLAAGRPGGRWPAAVLLGTGILVLVELILVALGYARFGYLFLAAGPAALVGLGGLLFLWPRLGRLAGAVCSLAAAGIVIAWFAGLAVSGFGFDPGIALGSIPAGLLLPLAIAWEGDRAVRLAEPAPAAPAAPGPPGPSRRNPGAAGHHRPGRSSRHARRRTLGCSRRRTPPGTHRRPELIHRAPAFVRPARPVRRAGRRDGRDRQAGGAAITRARTSLNAAVATPIDESAAP